MIHINKNSIEGLKLNTLKSEIDQTIVSKFNIVIEYDNSNRIDTLSVCNLNCFIFENTEVTFENIEIFSHTHTHIIHDGFYVFTSLNLVLYLDFVNQNFIQILIYDKSLSSIYEKEDPVTVIENKRIFSVNDLEFVPYKNLGKFKFGMQESVFTEQYSLTYLGSTNFKSIYQINNLLFRFDKDALTQVLFECRKSSDIVLLNSINLNDLDNLNKLISENIYLESFSHFIFTELGLAIGKNYKNTKDRNFFFFDESLLVFWKNTKRPITSW